MVLTRRVCGTRRQGSLALEKRIAVEGSVGAGPTRILEYRGQTDPAGRLSPCHLPPLTLPVSNASRSSLRDTTLLDEP